MKRYPSILAISALLVLTTSGAKAGTVDTIFNNGDTLTATHMTEIGNAINDNDSRINALIATGLHNVTVLDVDCTAQVPNIPNGIYVKIGDIGSFAKVSPTSTVEVQFNGRLYTQTINGNGVIFELRINDSATTNGRARANIRSSEAGGGGVPSSITGIFSGLPAGNHIVSIWARGAVGDASNAMWDPGCWQSDHVVIKEID